MQTLPLNMGPQAAEATFRGLLEAAPDAILGVDMSGVIVFANAQADQLFGYERSELLGLPVETLIPERSRTVHPAHRARYLHDPRPRPMGAGMELAGRRRDGSEFPAEVSLNTVDTPAGRLVAVAVRDVTERKRADAKFRGLLEAAPDAIVGVGADGRIALVNAQAERLFGYTRDELIGELVEILVPDASKHIHPSFRSRYFASPVPRPMGAGKQLAARRRDGSEFPAEISLGALETEEGLLVSAAVRDVSDRLEAQAERERLRADAERERLEKQLHQSQRLESLGQLAGGVAHDFNNLLGVILLYTSLIAQQLDKAQQEAADGRWTPVLSDVDRITQAANRATTLTHQLLAFARREVVRPRVLSLNGVVRDIEELLRRTIGEQVELQTRLAADTWPILADPGQLEQVLVNLAVNARDAMPAGGTLSIDTDNVLADDVYITGHPGIEPGRYVRLRVSDSGSGMPRDVVEHAFEPFYTTKPKGEGSGLGLATVYGIVKQAGGTVKLYSEEGIGTTFTALFPVSEELAEEGEDNTRLAPPPVHGHSVLVVEDEEALREVTCRILESHGFQVAGAANGEEALALVERREHPVDLLLTDVVMPKMLGKELAERLTARVPSLRVLYMSGYAFSVLTSNDKLADGVALVEKPFSEEQLLQHVAAVLDAPASRS